MRPALLCLLLGASCQATFSDELIYICANDYECGGGGYSCVAGVCCRPSGLEVCGDGKDNDCDGAIDEECRVTSQYTTAVDPTRPRPETICSDRSDNDGNGETDCADLSCAGQNCLEGTTQRCFRGECLCNGGRLASEDGVSCGDGLDNDCDGLIDCFEPNCASMSCGPEGGDECVCVGTRKAERSCANESDDDGDGFTDCADLLDCPEQTACTAALGESRRDGLCSAGKCAAEFCFDGVDNDGDWRVDCDDPDCSGRSCASDGGAGCSCTGGIKTEANCGDGIDNDGDGARDCGDQVDCPAGTACTRLSNGQPGVCQAASKACN